MRRPNGISRSNCNSRLSEPRYSGELDDVFDFSLDLCLDNDQPASSRDSCPRDQSDGSPTFKGRVNFIACNQLSLLQRSIASSGLQSSFGDCENYVTTVARAATWQRRWRWRRQWRPHTRQTGATSRQFHLPVEGMQRFEWLASL